MEQEKDSSNLNDKNNEEEDYSPDVSASKKFNFCCFFIMYSIIAFILIASFISGFVLQNMNDPEMAVNLWSAIVAAIGFAILPLIIHVWELIRRKRGWEPLEEGFAWKGIKLDDFKLLEDSEEKFEFIWDQSESGYAAFLFTIFMQVFIIITMIISIMYGGVSLVFMIIANVIFIPPLIIGSIIYIFFKKCTFTFNKKMGYFELVPGVKTADNNIIHLESNEIMSLEIKYIYGWGGRRFPWFYFFIKPLVGSNIKVYELSALPSERMIACAKWIGKKIISVCNGNFIGNKKFSTLD